MFNYFTEDKGLDNLLWVYGPNHGRKTTGITRATSLQILLIGCLHGFYRLNHIRGYAEIAQIKKPFGLTEYGARLE